MAKGVLWLGLILASVVLWVGIIRMTFSIASLAGILTNV